MTLIFRQGLPVSLPGVARDGAAAGQTLHQHALAHQRGDLLGEVALRSLDNRWHY